MHMKVQHVFRKIWIPVNNFTSKLANSTLYHAVTLLLTLSHSLKLSLTTFSFNAFTASFVNGNFENS